MSGPVEQVPAKHRPDVRQYGGIAGWGQPVAAVVQSLAVPRKAARVPAQNLLLLEQRDASTVETTELERCADPRRAASQDGDVGNAHGLSYRIQACEVSAAQAESQCAPGIKRSIHIM